MSLKHKYEARSVQHGTLTFIKVNGTELRECFTKRDFARYRLAELYRAEAARREAACKARGLPLASATLGLEHVGDGSGGPLRASILDLTGELV